MADEAGQGAGQKRAPLCRSADERVIAGVAGGIGQYFGIDPVIVRLAFIVFVVFGGAGLALYLLGWLTLPRAGSGSIIADALRSDSPRRARSVAAIVLIVVGLLIIGALSIEFFDLLFFILKAAPYLALMLIACGVALVLWPRPSKPTRAKPSPSKPSQADSPHQPGASEHAPRQEQESEQTDPAPGQHVSQTAPRTSGNARPRRGRRSMAGPCTVAALLLYAGGAVLLDRLGIVETDISASLAVALVITGAGLAASAFVGAARGLILIGVLLFPPLALFAGAEVSWWSGVGNRRIFVAEADDLKSEYRHGAGRLSVDLRGLELDGGVRSVDVGLVAGELLVYVPRAAGLTVEVNGGLGEIRVRDQPGRQPSTRGVGHRSESGLGAELRVALPAADETAGQLRLNVDLGWGLADVITVPALPAEEAPGS